MVASHTDIISRLNLCATLTHNNAASRYQLPIVAFHTKHLGIAVPAIAGATHTFFMCHNLFLCLAFSLLSSPRTAPSRCPFLFRFYFGLLGFGRFTSSFLCLATL